MFQVKLLNEYLILYLKKYIYIYDFIFVIYKNISIKLIYIDRSF